MFKRLFGKKTPARSDTPDWSSLSWVFDQQSTCACCGETGTNLLSIAYHRPDPYPSDKDKLPNAALLATDGDVLTEDFCRLDEHRLVRCVIEFPLIGRDEIFLIGVWGSLSQPNFDTYCDLFDARETDRLDPMTSWLCNSVPSGENKPASCNMLLQPDGNRPKLQVFDTDHPLFAAQNDGLSPDMLRDWLSAYGHSSPQLH